MINNNEIVRMNQTVKTRRLIMTTESKIIQVADFNPKIKTYIIFTVSFVLTITVVGIPLLIIWLLGFGKYISGLYYENLKCELTTHHLEFKKGAIFKIEKTIPLENIQDLTFIENPFLRYFDLRILKVETAGQSNPAEGSDMKLIGIINSAEFKQQILHQRELLNSGTTSEKIDLELKGTKTDEILLEIRDILNDIKNK